MEIVAIFSDIDDFCLVYEKQLNKRLLERGEKQRKRESRLSISEIMMLMVWFHQSGYRTFKDYYTVMKHLMWAFPKLVSYNKLQQVCRVTERYYLWLVI
ncbi:MAG: hypothetical protein JNN15_01985 [Blastocatellia bacterium]|nr:hypothetical protein [Blastocatellia bacterium]